jgi:energy-converting hydrogenase Eha subunit B
MNTLVLSFISAIFSAIFIGLGATLTFDLWGLFLKLAFKITPSNICLVGRWLRYMPEGTFKHSNIVSAPRKSAECTVGWIAHYMIGITFALVFVALVGNHWLQRPTLIPALVFGVVTVLAPFAIMQPSFGLGFAASKLSNPTPARVRSLMNHTAFGIGLYLFAWLVNWLLQVYA